MDLFEKVINSPGSPIAQMSRDIHGRYAFPRLTGEIGSRMRYGDTDQLVWSLNNYLGLANHPEVRAADARFAARYGLAAPMGSRMMSGETEDLELLESELAAYADKPAALFLNFGYQGMISLLDSLLSRRDWLVYDAECHACIIDGIRLHRGKAKSFPHNNIERLEAVLTRIEAERGDDEAVLVVTEGVFGMSGVQGRLRDIVALKQRFNFRLLVDDAHGFGVLGPDGGGTGEEQGCQDGIDLYFGTFAKAGASIGAFVASDAEIVWRLRYGMRSQIFSKGLPWPVVAGNRVRLDMMRNRPELRRKCLEIAAHLRADLRGVGLEIGDPSSAVTPVFLGLEAPQTAVFLELLRHRYGIFCSAVTYPVVPPGVVQLRLIATATHEHSDVTYTVDALRRVYEEVTGRSEMALSALR
ncbi:aminotransferase class I/II-fold pyridoxal phosphate-dependent enzyme [Plantactinospora soyae]|uniref:8-amino-7-oxononanoate synthase n=1 Tax=Plantactinospora soyae TaxID=1544732 RepID=A0A927MDM5_9ACTN|nr:pyridoxal phosphate-dependent aminotransferase family protein [Plantactinospora soyae]MBE1489818.1 glycine C-acetyltransferase [Plantactinospora soyae]